MSNLKEQYEQNKKLCTYAQFKTVFKFERYLDEIDDFKRRQCLSKLRMSAHNLEIEAGKYGKNKIPRNERYCKYCISLGTKVLGDEIHFLMICPLFEKERHDLLNKIQEIYPTLNLSTYNKFVWLLSQEDAKCLNFLSTQVNKCFKKKETFIS